MILFVSLAVLLVAAATLVLLGSHRKGVEEPARQSILSTYRQRQRDLAHERELGLLDEDSFAELSQELEQRLLDDQARSEEHTSELQSRGHLVCRLLLEKQNTAAHILI